MKTILDDNYSNDVHDFDSSQGSPFYEDAVECEDDRDDRRDRAEEEEE